MTLGDWVFPNTHPFFHGQTDPDLAAQWTKAAYEDIQRRAGRFVIFKEVGLPTAGDTEGKLSEANQDMYYQNLSQTNVKFVYFEGFDQVWKTTLPIEPHWGLFQSDRTPKLIANRLSDAPFYIYKDIDYLGNHFTPSGYMGDTGDIIIDEGYTENPHLGSTSIRVNYAGKQEGPYECYKGSRIPCLWAGVYWQNPPNNWGNDAFWKGYGFDLSEFKRLTFWARADEKCTVEFKVGGIFGPYGDSLQYPRTIKVELTSEWREYEIDLSDADLSHIIGGFVFAISWPANLNGATFYLDEIRFERTRSNLMPTPLPPPTPTPNPNIVNLSPDLVPTSIGTHWVYKITLGSSAPLFLYILHGKQFDQEVRGMYANPLSLEGDEFILSYGIQNKTWEELSIGSFSFRLVDVYSIAIQQDDLGIYEGNTKVDWIADSYNGMFLERITYPDPNDPTHETIFSLRPLFYFPDDIEPGSNYIYEENLITFQEKVGDKVHFTREIKPSTSTEFLGDYYGKGFIEDFWFQEGKGLVRLEQKVDGEISMVWELIKFVYGTK